MSAARPIRVRLATGAASLAAMLLAVFAVAVYAHMRHELFEEVDLELTAYGTTFAGEAGGEAQKHFRISAILLDGPSKKPMAAGAVLDNETVRAVLAQPARSPLTWRGEGAAWRGQWQDLGTGRLVVCYDMTEVDEILSELLAVCVASGLGLIGVATWSAWWWSGRALEPVRALKRAAEAIQPGTLHRRVPVPSAHDELRRLAEVVNAMLARIEDGYLQARRFTADASHELRTPLTIMRGELDRMLHDGEAPPGHEARLLRMQESTARLQRLTENLLLLARLDENVNASGTTATLDFSALVRETAEDGALLAEARGVSLQLEPAGELRVRGDADTLRRAVLNLFDNATRYNRPAGRVKARLAGEGGSVTLTVENTGPGIPPELRARLFQRFARGDAARSGGGHGLGLALAGEIARSHGGRLRLKENSPPDHTEFEFRLPRAAEGPANKTSD